MDDSPVSAHGSEAPAVMKYVLKTFAILVMLAAHSLPVSADAPSAFLANAFRSHCMQCHGDGGEIEGDTNLFEAIADKSAGLPPEMLEDILAVLRDQQMPPEDEPPLTEPKRSRMIAELDALLRQAVKQLPFEPTPIRRMNRFQYNNAVVDLLELDRDIFQLNERLMRRRQDYFRPETRSMPSEVRVSCRPLSKDIDNQRPEGFRGVAPFPQDKRAEHGFDNRADHLTMSPLLMESFLQLSQSIVESPDLNPKECRSWDRYFAKSGPDGESLQSRISNLLRRAFRRPVNLKTLERFTHYAKTELDAGVSFEQPMRTVNGAALAMPDFLYLREEATEPTATPGRTRVTDFELASRLAQFLWSSIPDDTLLDLAEEGQLSEPETLSSQIDRLMDDRRSSRFCDNFPSQWLQLERLVTSIPDPEKFPYFYYHGYRTSMHMMAEPLLLFETIYVEDRSIVELLAPEFTWQSDMLRANYEGHSNGRTDVQVQVFNRIPLDDPRRGGVITNLAIMTMTSTPTRTQPITRGAWINAVIFNDPPEPPPADVPPLPEADPDELAKLTIRERLAAHRERADCAGCHNKIDPLGFALENYGPTGVWREKYENGRDVDVSGVLFNQHEFKSVLEFKELMLQEKQRFIRGFVAHLLSYALGRDLGPADSPALDKLAKAAASGDDHMRAILKGVAMSEPFLHKNTGGTR